MAQRGASLYLLAAMAVALWPAAGSPGAGETDAGSSVPAGIPADAGGSPYGDRPRVVVISQGRAGADR